MIHDYEKSLEPPGADRLFPKPATDSASQTVRKHLDAANRYFQGGQLDLAVRETEQASKLAPQSMGIAVALGELYNRAGRYDDALKVARAVLESVPKSAQSHDIAGTAYLGKNQPALAAKEYQEVVRKAPQRAIGYRHLGDAYWAAGKPRDALAQYQEALRRDPRSVSTLVRSAAVMQELGDTARAVDRARQAVDAAPKHALARAVLGDAYVAGGKYPRSGSAVQDAAIRLQPRFTYVLEQLGALHAKLADRAKAIAAYRRVLSREPANLGAHRQLAALYGQENKPALAEYHLGFVAFATDSPKKAIDHYQAALRHDPKLKGAYLDLAAIYLKQQNPRAAAAAAEKAIALDGKDAAAYSLLGQSRRAEGSKAEAEKLYRQAIAVEPAYFPAHLQLADLLRADKRCADAVMHYGHALRLNPAAETYRKLGDCYQELGRTEEAAAAHRRAGQP